MSSNYHRYHDMLQALIDSIAADPDPHARLGYIQRLNTDARRMLLDARNEAAYDLRSRYSGKDAQQIAGVTERLINYWAKRWQKQRGLPPLKAKRRSIDLSNAIDLSR